MNRESNSYTFLFIGVMIVGIASILAYTSQTLKPLQKENIRKEKMQNILSTNQLLPQLKKVKLLEN